MTLPLLIQGLSALDAEYKDTQRRFVSQALLSITDPRAASADEVGKRAFGLYLSTLPAEKYASAQTRGNLEAFQRTAAEMLATQHTAPLISPHLLALAGGLLAAYFAPKIFRGL